MKIFTKEHCLKISLSKLGKKRPDMVNEKNPNWKGEDVGYTALHHWISRKYGTLKRCEDCGSLDSKKYEWANTTGIYNRDIKNWKRLCVKCHQDRDGHGFRGLAYSYPRMNELCA